MKYVFPMLKQSTAITNSAIPFSESYNGKSKGKWIHFYIDDKKFECLWNNPKKYLPMFKECAGVIGPDFSIYTDSPIETQIYNVYRNRVLSYWLQQNNIQVIPNIRWGKSTTYDFCFNGIPIGGTVAISTNGCIRDKVNRFDFRCGLAKMLEVVKPETVIVYGSMPNDIFEEHLEKADFINIPHWKKLLCKEKRCN